MGLELVGNGWEEQESGMNPRAAPASSGNERVRQQMNGISQEVSNQVTGRLRRGTFKVFILVLPVGDGEFLAADHDIRPEVVGLRIVVGLG